MARYFYTITRDGSTIPDSEGVDLRDDNDAWKQAVVTCAEIIRDEDGRFKIGMQWRLDVQAEDRRPLFTLRLATEDHRR